MVILDPPTTGHVTQRMRNPKIAMLLLCSRPQKGTSLGGTTCFGVFCVKIRPESLAVASCKNPKKMYSQKGCLTTLQVSLKLHHRSTRNFRTIFGQCKCVRQCCDVIANPRWRTAAILKIAKSPYLSEKSSDFDKIWYTTADNEPDDSHVTKN